MKSKILKILVFMLTVALMCASFAFVASAETEEVTTPTTDSHKFTIVAEDGAETPFEGTLKAAIAARAATTDVIRLEADATFGDDDRLNKVGTVNLDLNGKNVTVATTEYHFFTNVSNLTLTNGTIALADCAGNFAFAYEGYEGTYTFTGLTVTGAQGMFEIRGAIDFVVDSCNMTSDNDSQIFYSRVFGESYSYTVTDCVFNSATTTTGQCVFKFTNYNTSGEKVAVDLDLTNVTVNAPGCDFVMGTDFNGATSGVHYDVTMENVAVAEGATAFSRYARFDGLSTATVTSIGDNSPVYGYVAPDAAKHYFPYGDTLKTIIGNANTHGYTVLLCKDYTETTSVGTVAASEDVFTFDLCGHTLSIDLGATHTHLMTVSGDGGHVTLTNGHIVGINCQNLMFANCTSGQVDITFKGITLDSWSSTQFLGLRTKTCTVTIEDSEMNYNTSKGSFDAHRNYGTLTYVIKNSTLNLAGLTELISCTDYTNEDTVFTFDIEKSVITGSGVELINSKSSTSYPTGANTVNFNFDVNTPVEDIGAYTFNGNLLTNNNSATVNCKGAIIERTSSTDVISYVHASQIRDAIKNYVGVKLLGNYNYTNTTTSATTPVGGCVIDLNGFTLSLTTGGKHFLNGASGRTVTVKNGTIIQKSGNIFFVNSVYNYTLNLEDLNLITSSAAFDFRVKSMALNVTNLNVEGEDTVFSFRGMTTYYNEETGKFQVSAEDTTELVPLITVKWVGGVVNQPEMVSTIGSTSNGNTSILSIADYSANDLTWDINISGVDFNLGKGKLINLREDYTSGTTAVTGVNTTNISLENCTVKCGYFLAKMKDSFETTVSLTNVTALTTKDFIYGDVEVVDADVKFLVGSVGSKYVEGYYGEESAIARFTVYDDGSFNFAPTLKVSSNLTLYSDFNYNIFVYASEGATLKSVTINGVEYELFDLNGTASDKEGYNTYLVMYENIAPAYANDSFEVVYTVEYSDGKVCNASQTHSIGKYAKKILDGADTNESYAEAKQLVIDMLAYIQAAYSYIGGECAEITEVLGENVATAYDGSKDKETTLSDTGITSALLILGNEPAIRFYLGTGFEGSVTVSYTDIFGYLQKKTPDVEIADDGRSYVDFATRLYSFTEVLDIEVNGVSGTFDVYDYSNKLTEEMGVTELVYSLVAYAETAREYRRPPEEYTIVFDPDNGSSTESITVIEGNAITIPAEPTKDGYKFLGWYSEDVLITDEYVPTESMIVVAKWQKIHTVSFDTDGAGEIESVTVLDGESVTIPDALTKDGYEFLGWYIGDEKVEGSYVPAGDVTVTAKWIKKHTVSFDTDGVGEIESVTVLDGESVTIPDALTKDGYVFLGWYIGDTKVEGSYVPTGDVTVTAKFRALYVYTVSFDTDGGSIVDDIKVTEGDSFELPAGPTKAGYKFLGWYYNNELLTEGFVPTEDVVIVAEYRELAVYTVEFIDEDGNPIDSIEVLEGEVFTLPEAAVKDGYIFIGWFYEDELITEGFAPDGNVTLTAKYKVPEKFTVTYDFGNEDLNYSVTVIEGNGITLPVCESNEEYLFLGWYNGSERVEDGYVPSSDVTLTAKWFTSDTPYVEWLKYDMLIDEPVV